MLISRYTGICCSGQFYRSILYYYSFIFWVFFLFGLEVLIVFLLLLGILLFNRGSLLISRFTGICCSGQFYRSMSLVLSFGSFFLLDLEILNAFLLFLGKRYLGVRIAIAYKRVFMYSINNQNREIEFNKFQQLI